MVIFSHFHTLNLKLTSVKVAKAKAGRRCVNFRHCNSTVFYASTV